MLINRGLWFDYEKKPLILEPVRVFSLEIVYCCNFCIQIYQSVNVNAIFLS